MVSFPFFLPRISLPTLPACMTLSPVAQARIQNIYNIALRHLKLIASYAIKISYYSAITVVGVLFLWKFSYIFGMGLFFGLFIPQVEPIIQRVNDLWNKSYKIHITIFATYSFINFPVTIPWAVFLYSASLGNWIAHRMID